MTMKKILGIGELVWDVFPEGKQLGGAPVNFAFFAKELGAEAYPVAALGTDRLAALASSPSLSVPRAARR